MREDILCFYRVGRIRKNVLDNIEKSILRFLTREDAIRWIIENLDEEEKSPRIHTNISTTSSSFSESIRKRIYVSKDVEEGDYVIFEEEFTVAIYED